MLNGRSVREIAAALCVAAIFFFQGKADAQTNSLRMMTFNIHHAEGLDGQINVERIAELIKSEKADIVGLQEVDKGTTRVSGRDLPAELAQLTGMTCVFSNNLSYQGGQYGNAILTKFPIKAREHRLLQRVGNSEQRGWLRVVVNVHGRDLAFWNTHIDHRPDNSERLLAVNDFATWLENETCPVVFVGDFNDTPGSAVHTLMKEKWEDSWEKIGVGNGYTIPVLTPRSRIDYIWLSKSAPVEYLRAWVPFTTASDHLPVVLEMKLTNAISAKHVFQFPFDEGTGSTVTDSILGLAGSFVPQALTPPWTNDAPSGRLQDRALRFDGTYRAVIPDPHELIRLNTNNGDYTLEAWVKLATNFTPAARMILFQYEGDPGFSFSIATNRALHTTAFRKQDLLSTAIIPNDGAWHHLAAVHYDKSHFDFFVDGVLSSSVTYTNGPGSRSNPAITIGSAGNQANPFFGLMDRIRFSNRALSPQQFDYPAFPGPLPPELTVSRSESSLVINWPAAFNGYVLEASSSLGISNWTVTPHQVQGNENRAEILFEESTRFFRLKKNEN